MIGKVLGSYRIEALLASGGAAVLYRGAHLEGGPPAAIKFVSRNVPGYSGQAAHLRQEARLGLELDHPGIARVIGRGETEDGCYLVQELLAGKPLHHLLREETQPGRGLPRPQALGIAAEIAQALAHLHGEGIVHADLKPPNILCLPQRVVLCDLGLAVQSGSLRPPGYVVGTPFYMAPELAAGRMIDCRADIWSLGVIVFEMLTGARPFGLRTDGPAEVLRAIHKGTLPALLEDQPAAVRILVEFMLERNKMQRPGDAGALARQLRALA